MLPNIIEEIYSSTIPEFIYLREHHKDNEFLSSLFSQLLRKGTLSEKQIACISRAMAPKVTKVEEPKKQAKSFSVSTGAIIEIKPWLANTLKNQLGFEFFLRNIEIVEIHNETPKALIIDFKFVSKVVSCCHVCARNLEDDVSKAVGIGPVCAKKIGLRRPTVNEAELFLAEFESLCTNFGVIKNICIPKSQIKKITGQD